MLIFCLFLNKMAKTLKRSIKSKSKTLKMASKTVINDAVEYGLTMVGIPYRWYREDEEMGDGDKFWVGEGKITAETIKKSGKSIVCTGLINLMRRHVGLSIPTPGSKYPGGTVIWFSYLKRKGRLEKLNINTVYPIGTLLLAKFKSIKEDQGHVAVLVSYDGKSLASQQILHAFPTIDYVESEKRGILDVGSTAVTSFKEFHEKWDSSGSGYFTHICLPENWLLLD